MTQAQIAAQIGRSQPEVSRLLRFHGTWSDVDLLFVMGRPLSLMQLGRLEEKVSSVVGAPVDLVPESSLSPAIRDRAAAEAVPLREAAHRRRCWRRRSPISRS